MVLSLAWTEYSEKIQIMVETRFFVFFSHNDEALCQ